MPASKQCEALRARETQNSELSTVSFPDKCYSRFRILPARNVSMWGVLCTCLYWRQPL